MAATSAVARRVLLVEDDADTRAFMRQVIRHNGFQFGEAASVGEALGQLTRGSELPTHLLLDLMLPDADGTMLLRLIRQNNLPIRVALVTAIGRSSPALEEAERWKPDAIFHKPVAVAKIAAWLNEDPTV